MPYFNRALCYIALEKYPEAVKDLNKVLDVDPNDTEAYRERGQVHLLLKNYDQAIQDFSSVLIAEPKNVELYATLGTPAK